MIPVSYNGNGINDGVEYQAWFLTPVKSLPKLTANKAQRHGAHPRIGGISREGVALQLLVRALAGSREWLRALFNGEDGIPKVLVAADDNGSNVRYLKALCLEFNQTTQPGVFVGVLEVDDEVRWRAVTPTVHNWKVTGSGQTTTVSNGAVGVNDEAYPIIRATPRQYSVGLNPYRRFLPVVWPADQAAVGYPTDISNGALDTRIASTHFYSAAGNDIRVIVDGREVDYWLDGINTTGTSIWCNLDWQARQAATLAATLGAGAVASIGVNESIDKFPVSGILQIGSEVVTYSGKDGAGKRFTGITRAAKGSTAGAHSAGAPVRWIQHDIWVEYGSATLPAIAPDNSRKPIFNLATSSNTVWNYLEFFEEQAKRAGAWTFTNQQWTQGYGGNQKSRVSLYGELGIADTAEEQGSKRALVGHWSLYNPCGIVGANFLSGERYYGKTDWWSARLRSSVDGSQLTTHHILPSGTSDAWVAWSQSITPVSGARYIYLWLDGYAKNTEPSRVEASQVTVTLDSSKTPSASILPELLTYRMAATLTNQTTGDAIEIEFALNVGETLRIDVDKSEAIYEVDGSSQFAAVVESEGVRHRWLRLAPGANTLRWDEAGVIEVDVEIEFERRYFA